jgi:predicted kinase
MRTYRQLAERARAAIESSGGAVLDATFHRRAQRALLSSIDARVVWVECTAAEEVLRSRAAARERSPERGSDATWRVVSAQLAAWEPLTDVADRDRHLLRTDRPPDRCADDLDSFVSAAVDAQAKATDRSR